MRSTTTVAVVLVAAGLLAGARAARAQPATGQAETLFREGKRLMEAGKLAEACVAFEGSFRKDPVTSTLLNVADCREKNGQFATAWAAFVEAERRTRDSSDPAQQAIAQLSHDRAARLEPRLSHLTISVPDDSRIPGLVITRDGEPVDAAEWNRALPIDIGEHVIAAKAPAYEPWSTTATITAEREQRAVNVPRFKPLPKSKLQGNVIRLVEPSPFTPKRKLAVAVAGIGVISAGAGIALYFSASSTYDESKRTVDDARQIDLWSDANDKLLLSQVALGVGAAALGTAAVLWFTGKPTVTAESALTLTPVLTPTTTGAALSTTF